MREGAIQAKSNAKAARVVIYIDFRLSLQEEQMPVSVAVEEKINQPGAWTVELIGEDGEIYRAIFLGPHAKERANEYARLKYD